MIEVKKKGGNLSWFPPFFIMFVARVDHDFGDHITTHFQVLEFRALVSQIREVQRLSTVSSVQGLLFISFLEGCRGGRFAFSRA